ncbi:MAG: cryptochrome/photolyase family protein [Ferruginibacter sp.]|nr:cryptochrome/photolyase family protein [Ferruginibacter sp.]
MKEITIIFPHQLFEHHPAIETGRDVYLIEETLFFNQYNFHRQKLVLHRASMKAYEDFLVNKKIAVKYIQANTPQADIRKLLADLHQQNITTIHIADVVDDWLRRRVFKTCLKYAIRVVEKASPNFLNIPGNLKAYFDKKGNYFQTAFYTDQRRQRNILIDAGGQPEGGRWSFDADNRQKFPATALVPEVNEAKENVYVLEAKEYIAKNYPANYGRVEKFIYPVDFAGAEKWLDEFLKERFVLFGVYEDAIVAKEHFLHHSVISPLLNIGLLSPQDVIDKAIKAAVKYQVPLNSLEGFIRQILGWREFIRMVYEREGAKQRTKNYWGFTRKIPAGFWTGDTGIAPVDNVIKKLLQTGYSHHIERLMVIGNFMLLCEFDPDEVYRWFMEMYIDAYDWVMVPNVYGMTQFADGGLMTTKPYISGSNYLLKMSDYKKGEWTATWDGLFWRFMHVHRDFFLKNPRLGMLIKTFDKMPAEKKSKHLTNAENYLAKIDHE